MLGYFLGGERLLVAGLLGCLRLDSNVLGWSCWTVAKSGGANNARASDMSVRDVASSNASIKAIVVAETNVTTRTYFFLIGANVSGFGGGSMADEVRLGAIAVSAVSGGTCGALKKDKINVGYIKLWALVT